MVQFMKTLQVLPPGSPATVHMSRRTTQRGGDVPSLPEQSVPAVSCIATHHFAMSRRRRT
jgi:hypothetical protein